jgi:hypothetical protein
MLSTPKEGLVPFLRDKLFLDIVASCKHRSTAIEDSTEITQIIINEALAKIENGSLSRSELVIVSANVLKRFDAAAATVYLAYHPL